jgi:hypothetical protein
VLRWLRRQKGRQAGIRLHGDAQYQFAVRCADLELQVGKQTVCTGATGEFELTVGKRKAYAVAVEGWKIGSGAEIEAGELVTIVVDH